MKKLLKFLIGFFGAIIGLILIIVIVLVILFYNGKDVTHYEVVDREYQATEVINNTIYDGLNDVTSTKEAMIVFDEEDLEALLYPMVMTMNNFELPVEITGADVDVKDGNYYLEVSVKAAKVVKTVITAQLHFENAGEEFSIQLQKLKLGKVNFAKLSSILSDYVDEATLESELKNRNINVSIDLETLTISMTYENIKNMIIKNMDDGNRDLISLLFDVFLTNEELLSLSFGDEDLLGAILHLSNIEYNSSEKGALKYIYNFEAIKLIVNQLLEDELISLKNSDIVFNYYVRGYKNLKEEEKLVIDELSTVTELGNDYKDYKGIINRSDITINNYFIDMFKDLNILNVMELLINGIEINDDTLSLLLQQFEYIGLSYVFYNYEHEINYLVIEQVNMICKDQFLDLLLVINVNGVQVYIEATFDCNDSGSTGLKIKGNVKDINIGNYNLTEEQKGDLLEYLNFVFSNLEWVSINQSDNSMTLDFSNAMSKLISSNSIISSLIGDTFNSITNTYVEDGYIAIKFELN